MQCKFSQTPTHIKTTLDTDLVIEIKRNYNTVIIKIPYDKPVTTDASYTINGARLFYHGDINKRLLDTIGLDLEYILYAIKKQRIRPYKCECGKPKIRSRIGDSGEISIYCDRCLTVLDEEYQEIGF